MRPQRCPEARGSILEARNRSRVAQSPSRLRFSIIFAWIFKIFCYSLAINLLHWRCDRRGIQKRAGQYFWNQELPKTIPGPSRPGFSTISARISFDFLYNLPIDFLHCRHHLLFSFRFPDQNRKGRRCSPQALAIRRPWQHFARCTSVLKTKGHNSAKSCRIGLDSPRPRRRPCGRVVQRRPFSAQDASKTPPRRSKTLPRRPKTPPRRPKTPPRPPKTPPRRAGSAPRCLQDRPRRLQGAQDRLQDGSKTAKQS